MAKAKKGVRAKAKRISKKKKMIRAKKRGGKKR